MISIRHLFKIIPFLILLAAIDSIQGYSSLPIHIVPFWWFIQGITLLIFWRFKFFFDNETTKKDMVAVKWLLLWNVLSIGRGLFIAETYWDWKAFTTISMGILIPVVVYSVSYLPLWQSIFRFFIKYALPIFLPLCLFVTRDAYGFYLAPVIFLIFFVPVLPFKVKILIAVFSVWVICADFSARSNVIKFSIPFMLFVIYWMRGSVIMVKFLEIFRWVLMVAPFILFFLAVADIFNPFNMDKYIGGHHVEVKKNPDGEVVEESLTADTRTFLYVEVLNTAKNNNSWIIGRSPARGTETEWFADVAEVTGRKERPWNEAAILNVFIWTGIVGLILYMAVFFRASYLAINKSNNVFCKMMGIFIAFRWLYAWVEDGNLYTISTIFLWVMIGVCLSSSFRSMTDDEMTTWARGIFEPKAQADLALEEMELESANY